LLWEVIVGTSTSPDHVVIGAGALEGPTRVSVVLCRGQVGQSPFAVGVV